MKNIVKKIIIHHSADAFPGNQTGKINEWHKQRNFTYSSLGFWVGYHAIFHKDGTITETRRESEIGCHCRGLNSTSLGWCLEGHFSVQKPTKEQEERLGRALAFILKKHKLSVMDIDIHRAFSATECPGKNIDADWARRIYIKYEINRIKKIISWLTIKLNKMSRG